MYFAATTNKFETKTEIKSTNSGEKNISLVNNSAVSSVNDIKQIDKLNSANNKMTNCQPYPINLKVERIENSQSVVITWDTPPVLPVTDYSTKQSFDLSEQLIVNYQIYLNHEIHSLVKPNQNRSIIIDKIDFNKVSSYYLNEKSIPLL